jgi:hypothetical protein
VRIAIALELGDGAEFLDAHLAYHLHAGVDIVIAPVVSDPTTGGIIDRYVQQGHVVRGYNGRSARERRAHAAQIAATEHRADWLIATAPNEFWWPRGTGLHDVLVAVPPRYGVVQALTRDFRPQVRDGLFAERMTVRDSLVSASPGDEPLWHLLRPVQRLVPGVGVHGGQPLRAWYPIEVLRFPAGDAAHHSLEDEDISSGLADGSLTVDERLRDALRELHDGHTFDVPRDGTSSLAFRNPTIVDDAQYAVECAAIGEVNLDRLDRQIRELEGRIAWLEERLWPRVIRRVSRLARGRIRPRG